MSGRAGRLSPDTRDDEGHVFSLIARKQTSLVDLKRFEAGTMEPIESRLDLSYRTLLSLFGRNDATPNRMPWSIDEFWKRTLAYAESVNSTPSSVDPRYSMIHARWKLLGEAGYVDGHQVTAKGKLCLALSNQELTITEAWDNRWLDQLSPVEIAAVFGCLNCDRKNAAKNSAPRTIKPEWWNQLTARVNELRRMELELGIPKESQIPELNDSAEPLFIQWAEGAELDSVRNLLRDENRSGDFINWTRMAIQCLSSLITAAKLQSENINIARLIEARSLLERDEVLWEKLQ